jgi:2-oxoisovalerate dehydrogenase E2 component (dihydrolipoyl transacylase)
VAELLKLRSTLKSLAEPYQVNITLMPLIMKAASLALTEYPVLNSSLDLQSESIIFKVFHEASLFHRSPNCERIVVDILHYFGI